METDQTILRGHADYLIEALEQHNEEQIQYHIDSLLADGSRTALSELIRIYSIDARKFRTIPRPNITLTEAILDQRFVDKSNISLFIDFASVAVHEHKFKAYSRLREFDSCLAKGGLRGLIAPYTPGILGRIREGSELFASSSTVSQLIDNDGCLIQYMPTETMEDARLILKTFHQRTLALQEAETLSVDDNLFIASLTGEERRDCKLQTSRSSHGLWAIPQDVESLSREEYVELVEIPSILTACWLLHKRTIDNEQGVDAQRLQDTYIKRLISKFSRFELFREHAATRYGNTSYQLICLLQNFKLTDFLQTLDQFTFTQKWKRCLSELNTYETNQPSPFLPIEETLCD